jgi:protein-L-isoaspartate(D-aspartate) O-methyltransferase
METGNALRFITLFLLLIFFLAILPCSKAGNQPHTLNYASAASGDDKDDPYKRERESMVNDQILDRGISDQKTLNAMLKVKRHLFVPESQKPYAYEDRPLPIGYGQTISQPYIVAFMTEFLKLRPEYKVLEIGTGSGYQAAVLAEIVKEVYTVEIIPELGRSAAERLKSLGYENIKVRVEDGYYGWEENSPYDAIIVTAAAGSVPPPLIKQLKDGGKMIIPVGSPFFFQYLVSVEKSGGEITTKRLIGVSFVPLTRSSEND